MTIECIVRAWKDEEYRTSLSLEEQAGLPSHPAGLIELSGVGQGTIANEIPPPTGGLSFDCCTTQPGPTLTIAILTVGCCDVSQL